MVRLLSSTTLVLAGCLAVRLAAQPAATIEARNVAEIVVTDIAVAYAPEDARDGREDLELEPWPAGGLAVGDTVGARVDYFTVVPERIQLGVGGRLSLAQLRIETHGLDGETVPRAPLKITVEAPAGMLDIDLAVAEQTLIALEPGIGRLWIESQLPRGTGTGERYTLPVPIVVR